MTDEWQFYKPQSAWRFKGGLMKLSPVDTDNVLVGVRFSQSGSAVDISGTATVDMAFMPANQIPGANDWVAGTWQAVPTTLPFESNIAQVLVGPTGKSLLPGTYVVWIKVTNGTIIPARPVGSLVIGL